MAKIAAKGAIVQVEISSTLTAIPSVGDFEIDFGETEEVDVTTHDSTGGTREYVNGFKNPADITIPLKFEPENTVHQFLETNHGGDAQTFKVILPDAGAAELDFAAIIKGFSISAPVDGPLEATVTLKPSDITFTP